MLQPARSKPPFWGPLSTPRIRSIFACLAEHIQPEGELHFSTPFELLVAVVLSAQTTDKAVNHATAKLFPVANTPASILALGEAGLAPYIRTIGLWRSKAKHVMGLCQALLDRHGGEVPRERAALEALPGVGRKTAGVVRNIAFGKADIPVDTHVHRVANRLGIANTGDNRNATEDVLTQRVPRAHRLHAHHYLLLHGRYTCVARAPRCAACPLRRWCLHADAH